MRKTVLVTGTMPAALSATAFAGGNRHLTLPVGNQTAPDFTNGNPERRQVHVDTLQTTVREGRTGFLKFHFGEERLSDVMLNVTSLVASDDGAEGNVKPQSAQAARMARPSPRRTFRAAAKTAATSTFSMTLQTSYAPVWIPLQCDDTRI